MFILNYIERRLREKSLRIVPCRKPHRAIEPV
jgi:hypothetical protein